MSSEMRQQAERAQRAKRALARLDRGAKDAALSAIAEALRAATSRIADANARDVERARASGLSGALLGRLDMGPEAVEATARAVLDVRLLDDPVGSRGPARRLPNGLLISRQRLPLGVVAMIYESRPNVTVDAASLCFKSGNAVLLRGGKEAAETNAVLGDVLRGALSARGLPEDAVQIVPPTDRDGIRELVSLTGLIDLCIPRGGEGLIRFVAEHARVPIVNHWQGVCHLFLDRGADVEMACALAHNGKVQRPGVCNALECLLVDASLVDSVLPIVATRLRDAGVELRGCERTVRALPWVRAATPGDFGREFLDLILAVRVVDDLDAALDHVARYGSNHSEAICTPHLAHAERWLAEVDASCVLVNASTRFNDGGQLGLGAEIGISTTKLHAYGPMGLESLTSEKWIVQGNGQIR